MPEDKGLTDKAAADRAAADKAAVAERASSVEGAQSVADAVRRVADAAVDAVRKQPVTGAQYDFDFVGTPGGTFRIHGTGLGASGTAKLNGRQLTTRWWGTMYVEGDLPADAESGEVTLDLGDKNVRRGYYQRA